MLEHLVRKGPAPRICTGLSLRKNNELCMEMYVDVDLSLSEIGQELHSVPSKVPITCSSARPNHWKITKRDFICWPDSIRSGPMID
jgi:hypothetical protein